MTSVRVALSATATLAVAIALMTGGVITARAADPTPAPTGVAVTVVIPEPTPSATTGSGGSTGGASGGSNSGSNGSGGSTGGASGSLPTEPFGAPVPPGQPTSGAGALQLDRDTIAPQEWLTATGTGFTAGEKVQFVYYPGAAVINSFIADSAGKVVAKFLIPEDMRSGLHTLEATGWSSKKVLNKEFTVTTVAATAPFPYLWWVFVVLGVLLLGVTVLALYFRRSIRQWFGPGAAPSGAPS